MVRARGSWAGTALARWLLTGALAGLLSGCAAMIEEASRGPAPSAPAGPVSLMPMASLREGLLTDRLDVTGMPRPAPGMAPVRLVRPVAVAARDGDVYVADAGAGVLYRVDLASQQFVRVLGVRVDDGTRLALGVDRVLHVLDRAARRIVRLSPAGRLLPGLAIDPFDLSQPVDLAADESLGTLMLADGLTRQVLALPPGGGAYRVLALRGDTQLQLGAIERIALGPRHLYLVDPRCACVLFADREGLLLGRLAGTGPGPLSGIAADAQGRVYLADAAAREIRVLVDGRQIQTIAYRSLGLVEVADLRVSAGILWAVDPLGAKLEARRILPRALGGGAK